MTLRDYFASVIRTLVPVALGVVLTKIGITDATVQGIPLDVVVSVVAVGGYYAGVRALEKRWPLVGVLLGWAAAPIYLKAPLSGPYRLDD